MTVKKFIRAFVAGMLFPAVFLPIAYTFMYIFKIHNLHTQVLQFVPMYIPILFGLTNVLYVQRVIGESTRHANKKLWLTGIVFGLIIAAFGVYVLHLPTVIFGFTNAIQYAPLIIIPIFYGAIFRFIIKWLNKIIAV